MKRSFLLAALSLPAVYSAGVQANERLEHVLVSVPLHKSAAETALPVTVLRGDELREQAALSIGATLGQSPGLFNSSFGPAVGQPVIRGQQGPRVTVLQNGTGTLDAASISADHAVTVEPVLADSIEVIRGPATLLYGGGAIGGVVNVRDNRVPAVVPEQLSGAAEVRHGSAADETTSAFRLDGGSGQWAWHLNGLYRDWNDVEVPGLAIRESGHEEDHDEEHEGEHEEMENSDGYIANTDGRMHSVTAGFSWVGENGYLGFAVNRLENQYGIPPGAHEHHHEEGEGMEEEEEGEEIIRLNIEQTRYDVAGEWRALPVGLEVLRWRLTRSDYEHVELEGAEVGTRYSNDAWENRFELVHAPIAGWHGVIGWQWREAEFAAIGEESFVPETDERSVGLFILEDYHHQQWTYELGLRLDYDRWQPAGGVAPDKSYTSLSASAAALWAFQENWQLGLALSRSERAPLTQELYSNAGNPESDLVTHAATRAIEVGCYADVDFNCDSLDQEVARNLDLTLSWQAAPFTGFVTLFYNDFSDYIYLQNAGIEIDETAVQIYSQQDARFYGLEFEQEWQIDANWSATLFGDWVDGELSGGVDVPRIPPHRVGLRLDYSRDAWQLYTSVIDAARQNRPGVNETETDGYTRWDAGVNYTLAVAATTEATVFLRLLNATDEEIRSSTSFLRDFAPEPGRSLEAGIRLTF